MTQHMHIHSKQLKLNFRNTIFDALNISYPFLTHKIGFETCVGLSSLKNTAFWGFCTN